jgi:two-component system, NarL family, sensor histidine kinase UhpB
VIDATAPNAQSRPHDFRARDAQAPTDAPRVASRTGNRLNGLPILYKVLIANAAIVALGAVAGTWLTIQTVRHAAEDRFIGLAAGFVAVGIVASVVANYVVLRAAFRPLATLEQTALAVRGGDLSARAAPTSFMDPQVAHLAETFNATLDELARDRAELRSLASQVIRAQEDERRRIARELHDDTAQVLFAQLLRLTTLKGSPDPTVHSMAATLEEMTVEALEGVRRLALELRPPALDDLGLSAALGELAQRFAEQLDVPVDYRVAQEALTNVAKHATARKIWLDVDRTVDDVTISIRDDGRGFDRAVTAGSDGRGLGLGIFGMEERVALVGGRFRIWSKPGVGTEIFAFIPLAAETGARGRIGP